MMMSGGTYDQMSIFDFLEVDYGDINNMTEEDMVRKIHEATGLNFRYRDSMFGWEAKEGKVRYNVKYSNYNESIHNGRRHISCGWQTKMEGCGVPRDSLEEAIDFLKTARQRMMRETPTAILSRPDGN